MQVRLLRKRHPEDNNWILIETKKVEYALRFGRPRQKLFSERNQGTHNIPTRWKYYFGEHLSIRTFRRFYKRGRNG